MTPSPKAHPEPASSLRESGHLSNVVYLTPRQMVEATRDTEAGWSPIDEDTAYRNAIFDLIGDYLPWAVCFIVMGLIGLWLACGHS